MFSKIVKHLKPTNTSLRQQITVTMASTFVVLLLLVSGMAYFSLETILSKAAMSYLIDESSVMIKILDKDPDDIGALEQEVNWNPYPQQIRKDRAFFYYIRLLTADKGTLLETNGMSKRVGTSHFSKPVLPNKIRQHIKHINKHHKDYLLINIKVPTSISGAVRYVQIALDTSFQYEVIEQYWWVLLGLLLMSGLMAIIISYFTAKRCMQPITEMSRMTHRITSEKLDQRLSIKNYPHEFAVLGESVNAMLNRIEDSFNRLQQFSSDLAHELRTPLGNLLGEAEIVLRQARGNDEYRQVIESSLEEYQRLQKLTESILYLAKIENPKRFLAMEMIDVREIIQHLLNFYEMLAEEKHISFTLSGEGTIQAEKILFQQALSNIISNALKYSYENSEIDIRICSEAEQLTIEIKDNGIGMSPEHLPMLFQRFYRVDKDRSAKSGGTGLGLAIVKSIMTLHQGDIKIESHPGIGTTVKLVFKKEEALTSLSS